MKAVLSIFSILLFFSSISLSANEGVFALNGEYQRSAIGEDDQDSLMFSVKYRIKILPSRQGTPKYIVFKNLEYGNSLKLPLEGCHKQTIDSIPAKSLILSGTYYVLSSCVEKIEDNTVNINSIYTEEYRIVGFKASSVAKVAALFSGDEIDQEQFDADIIKETRQKIEFFSDRILVTLTSDADTTAVETYTLIK